jgi:hypothetical protein
MQSLAAVIGWQEIGLALDSSFLFYPQKVVVVGVDINSDFADPNFLANVWEILGKPADPIYDVDVANIGTLDVSGQV